MAITSRQGLIDYCFRKLGDPVIEINVDLDQVEDRVDDALELYQEYHHDATFRNYLIYKLTADDITNKYITIDDQILFVTKMFPMSNGLINSRNMFSFQYQFAMSDMWGFGGFSGDLAYYDQVRQYMNMLDMKLNGSPQFTYARRQNRIYFWGDIETRDLKEDDYVIFEVYQIVDPSTFTQIYNDMFLKDYTTALIKQQWGQNMSKFEGMQLPGGVTISGRQILEEAKQELTELKEAMRLEHEMPPEFFVG